MKGDIEKKKTNDKKSIAKQGNTGKKVSPICT